MNSVPASRREPAQKEQIKMINMKAIMNLRSLRNLRNLKSLISLTSLILFLGACSQDDELGRDAQLRVSTINITAADFASDNPETRASESGYVTTFTSGDKIGITVLSSANAILQDNIPCTYNGTAWTPDGAATITDVTGGAYLAYYPYSATMSGKKTADEIRDAFTPKADQSAYTDYTSSDLMTGTGAVSATTLTIGLTHALALIEVSLPATATAATLKAGTTAVTPCKIGDSYRYIAKPQTGVTLSGGYTYLGATLVWEKTGVALTVGKYTKIGVKTTITDLLGISLAFIPKGTFMMGSPTSEPYRYSDETQHPVTLTKDFYMSKYQVTNAQYAAFLNANNIGNNGLWASGSYPAQRLVSASNGSYNWGLNWDNGNKKWVPVSGYDNHPVIYVTWYGADEYARWVGGSLPTEAQWEYACRGDYPDKATEVNTPPFGIGTGRKLTGDMANFYATRPYDLDHNPSGDYDNPSQNVLYQGKTTAVGSYPDANNYGLYDMHGNVYEWCSDWYGNYDSGSVSDPNGSATGSNRVFRGGGWISYALHCRSAFRNNINPVNAYDDLGFRVVFVP
ncbi:hypothetical protein FACS189413_00940 [Bacteroidia bacterium]|nr:hypothetical protein FACS189413_00940 [Bacteroidia bacterium]